MTRDEFQTQIVRLVKVYGPSAYPEERMALIWNEVSDFEIAWLAKAVDQMIGTLRQPPLLEAFTAAATVERERRWTKERDAEKVAAKDFFTGRKQYNGDDALRFKMVRDLLDPNLPAESRASILAHFGPADLGLEGHAALTNPRVRGQIVDELPPEELARLGERQRRNLPYADN